MRRRLFTVSSALSLLLSLTVVVFWLWACNGTLAIGNHYTTGEVDVYDGCAHFCWWKYDFDVKAISQLERPFIRFYGSGFMYLRADTYGYEGTQFAAASRHYWADFPHPPNMRQYFAKCPLWLLAALFAIAPAYWLLQWRTR